jgi:hypothetical protein
MPAKRPVSLLTGAPPSGDPPCVGAVVRSHLLQPKGGGRVLKRVSRFAINNAIALLALFLALGGASYAASGALKASPQYKACVGESHIVVLKTGRRPCGKGKKTISWNQQGPAGAKGAAGAAGATGTAGTAGAAGANGFSALSTLPSGASESGAYSVETGNATVAQLTESQSFSIPLAAPIDVAHVQYLPVLATSPNCPGVGQAARGFLCLYSGEETGLVQPEVFNFESGKFVEGTGRFGFSLQWGVLLKEAFEAGAWTVTAA